MSPIYIQWYTNNQALTWTLLHTLQEFPHCRNVLWPLGTSCNHPSCLNIAASILSQSVFMPNALYSNALAADPEHYHRSIKTKVTELGMLYSVLKQALITVGEARMDKELYGMLLEDVWTEYSLLRPYYFLLCRLNGDPEPEGGPGSQEESDRFVFGETAGLDVRVTAEVSERSRQGGDERMGGSSAPISWW